MIDLNSILSHIKSDGRRYNNILVIDSSEKATQDEMESADIVFRRDSTTGHWILVKDRYGHSERAILVPKEDVEDVELGEVE